MNTIITRVVDIMICVLLLLLLLHAGNAPYVNRFEAMNRRRGWSSLVVTQPSTSHHCVGKHWHIAKARVVELYTTSVELKKS